MTDSVTIPREEYRELKEAQRTLERKERYERLRKRIKDGTARVIKVN